MRQTSKRGPYMCDLSASVIAPKNRANTNNGFDQDTERGTVWLALLAANVFQRPEWSLASIRVTFVEQAEFSFQG
jgi:hypothetical protein